MGKFLEFLKVVAWDTSLLDDRASGCPCCGTCFPSWDPKAPAFVGPPGCRLSQGRIFPHWGHSFTIRQLRPHSCHLSLTAVEPVVWLVIIVGWLYKRAWSLLAWMKEENLPVWPYLPIITITRIPLSSKYWKQESPPKAKNTTAGHICSPSSREC